jgi:acyl carrier protein
LVELWSQVLGIEKENISTNANFFQLGGHSLKATLLMARIHQELNTDLPLVKIFRTPTIKGLARIIQDMAHQEFVPLELTEEKEFYPLSAGQKRMFILQQIEKASTNYNISFALVVEGEPDKERIEESLKTLIRRHESFRTSFAMKDNKLIQHIYPEAPFEIEYYQSNPESVQELMSRFIKFFDLSKPPLFRVGLVRTVGKGSILMLDMNHIITDGTSMQILKEEFAALYAGNELPALKYRYKDFAVWQNQEAHSLSLKGQEKYWLEVFKTLPPLLNLPTDYPRPAQQSFAGKGVDFALGQEETTGLKQISLKENLTLYMVIMALFNILMARLSQQEDIVIGTPIAGRKYAFLQNLTGFFVNTLAQRNYPTAQKSFREFLNEVRENTLRSFENQEYQFEDLVDKVIKYRDPGRNPLFDVMFAFQNLERNGGIHSTRAKDPGWGIITDNDLKENTQFDLLLYGFDDEGENKLKFRLEYCIKLFKEETIKRFIGYFKDIIRAVLENPGVRLGEIDLSLDLPATQKKLIRDEEGDFEF